MTSVQMLLRTNQALLAFLFFFVLAFLFILDSSSGALFWDSAQGIAMNSAQIIIYVVFLASGVQFVRASINADNDHASHQPRRLGRKTVFAVILFIVTLGVLGMVGYLSANIDNRDYSLDTASDDKGEEGVLGIETEYNEEDSDDQESEIPDAKNESSPQTQKAPAVAHTPFNDEIGGLSSKSTTTQQALAQLTDSTSLDLLETMNEITDRYINETYPAIRNLEQSNVMTLESYVSPQDAMKTITLIKVAREELLQSETIAIELYAELRKVITSIEGLSADQRASMLDQFDQSVTNRPSVQSRNHVQQSIQGFYDALLAHYEFIVSRANNYLASLGIDGYIFFHMKLPGDQEINDQLIVHILDELERYVNSIEDYATYYRSIPDEFIAYVITHADQDAFDAIMQADIKSSIKEYGGLPYYEAPWFLITRIEYQNGVVTLEADIDLLSYAEDPESESEANAFCSSKSSQAMLERADFRMIFNLFEGEQYIEQVEKYFNRGQHCTVSFM